MKCLAVIRTHVWDEACNRLYKRLRFALKRSVVVVFHNRPEGIVPPVPFMDMRDDWPQSQGIFAPADWGWRCGDYSLYAARQTWPDYDHYWLIEPDVHFTSYPGDFFEAFNNAHEDLLGYEAEVYTDNMRFIKHLPEGDVMRSTFALTRMSGRAIDYLFGLRQIASKETAEERFWPNDEFFCWTHIARTEGYSFGRLEDYAPNWLEGTAILPGPDLLLDAVNDQLPEGRVVHPVRDRTSYLRALARRAVGSAGFLDRNRAMMGYFSQKEIDDHVAEVAQLYRTDLIGAASSRAARMEQSNRRQRAYARKKARRHNAVASAHPPDAPAPP